MGRAPPSATSSRTTGVPFEEPLWEQISQSLPTSDFAAGSASGAPGIPIDWPCGMPFSAFAATETTLVCGPSTSRAEA